MEAYRYATIYRTGGITVEVINFEGNRQVGQPFSRISICHILFNCFAVGE